MIERVTHKIIKSGNIIEFYKYEKGYLKGYELTESEKIKNGRTKEKSNNYEENRKQVLQRAKKNLRRLINANVGQYGKENIAKFVTLTFKENITDIKHANYEFEKFIKRLNYEIYGYKCSNLKYTCVIEFQKRGAIHYHVIFYNLPFTKSNILESIWQNGFIKINKIDNVTNVGAYVSEYLGSAEKGQGHNIEDDRLQGKKSYFSSRGLYKPTEITDKKIVEQIATALPSKYLTYFANYENEHLGDITYIQYNLKSL